MAAKLGYVIDVVYGRLLDFSLLKCIGGDLLLFSRIWKIMNINVGFSNYSLCQKSCRRRRLLIRSGICPGCWVPALFKKDQIAYAIGRRIPKLGAVCTSANISPTLTYFRGLQQQPDTSKWWIWADSKKSTKKIIINRRHTSISFHAGWRRRVIRGNKWLLEIILW